MGTISKTSEKCQGCPYRGKCDHKRMEACAYYDEPQIAANAGVSAGISAAASALRETMQINVGGVMTTVYKDEIEKEICKALHESFSINYGA